jgi:hypothetical protein
VVFLDEGGGIFAECPDRVDPTADPGSAIGLVLGHQGVGQRQGGGGVVEGAAAQAGPAAVPVRLVVGEGAAVYRGRGGEQLGDAAALAVVPDATLGLVVVDLGVSW